LASQKDLKKRGEHCSVDAQTLAAIGCAAEQQVRIVRTNGAFGLYTVSEVGEGNAGAVVRMGQAGRERVGTITEFDGVISSQVPHPTLADDEAEEQSEFVERLGDDGLQSGLIVIAPHGGDIEGHTDEQAEHVASRLAAKAVSSWVCKGWKCGGGALHAWHITSTDISPASFPLLASVISRGFTHAVAFHGYDEEGRPDVLVGGAAPTPLKEEIEEAVRTAVGSGLEVAIAEDNNPFGGADLRNIVNRLSPCGADCANGIQLEQSRRARSGDRCLAIADAVAGVYRRKLD
jgi:phage replication-related protein YjqB (UPF0714/DUF867 family)